MVGHAALDRGIGVRIPGGQFKKTKQPPITLIGGCFVCNSANLQKPYLVMENLSSTDLSASLTTRSSLVGDTVKRQ